MDHCLVQNEILVTENQSISLFKMFYGITGIYFIIQWYENIMKEFQ